MNLSFPNPRTWHTHLADCNFGCWSQCAWWVLQFIVIATLLIVSGCRPLPGTTSSGFGSRLGMGPQNRAIGNTAFNPVGYGESAYGRVAYGPGVDGILGTGTPAVAQGNSMNAGAGSFGPPTAQAANPTANPFTSGLNPAQDADNQQQVQNLTQQLNRFNTDNTDLYRQLATMQQQLQLTNDTNTQLRQQLVGVQGQAAQFERVNQDAQQRLQVLQTSVASGQNGFQGATLRANNSLMQNIDRLRIPGTTVEQDKDVIRVLIPSDYLFQAGSYDLQPGSTAVLNQVAAAIRQYYPSQIVGVEAHWDSNSLGNSPVSQHQVTTGQALTVLNQLTGAAGMPVRQLFVMGYGSNRPKYSNATAQGQSANRRIELVVYPEQF